jgi:hypothetical protein
VRAVASIMQQNETSTIVETVQHTRVCAKIARGLNLLSCVACLMGERPNGVNCADYFCKIGI